MPWTVKALNPQGAGWKLTLHGIVGPESYDTTTGVVYPVPNCHEVVDAMVTSETCGYLTFDVSADGKNVYFHICDLRQPTPKELSAGTDASGLKFKVFSYARYNA